AWRWHKHTWIATMFAFVTGYADIVSLIRYRAFASMLTGNAIMLGKSVMTNLSASDHGPWYYVFICLSFFAGSILQRLCEHYFPNRGSSIAAVPLAAIVVIAESVEILTSPNMDKGDIYQDWTVAGVALLFGVVASACSTGRLGTHTTMVTGHVLSLANFISSCIVNGSVKAEDGWKAAQSMLVVVGTLAGALFGGLLVKIVDVYVLLIPVPIVLYILLWLHDHLAKPRSIIKNVQRRMRASAEAPSESVEKTSEECTASGDESSENSSSAHV
ncbi:unnamed protein product, partial [Symbiodinium pilosum]